MTAYMSLDLPVVSTTIGPAWATLLNAALTVVDDHDHTDGKGRKITSAALNINDDVAINTHNLTGARSYNMSDLSVAIADATDVRSIYAVDGELYYNDSVGNQIQLTSDGAINAASIGSISGLGATTATVAYSSISKTFTFNQNTNQRAKLDIGDLIIRQTLASTNGVTIKSPASLAASYELTLPAALPASNKMLQISTTGVLSPEYVATAHIDPAGLGSAAYATGSVGTAAIADDSITAAKISPTAGIVKFSKQTFNSAAGDYPLIVPVGVTTLFVRGTGGGGGGGGGGSGAGGFNGGGGGGAGSQVRSGILTVVGTVSNSFAPSDVNISTEIITANAHGYAENQSLIFTNSGGSLPGGLTASTVVYYAKDVTTNTFKVSATAGGSAVNISSQGSGTHTAQSVLVVRIAAGGAGGAGNASGSAGAEGAILNGATKLIRFTGGAFGGAGIDAGGTAGSDFTWENQSTPGGHGGASSVTVSVAGSSPATGEGIGGAAGGGAAVQAGGGGGGSIGTGSRGGAINNNGGGVNDGFPTAGFGAGGGGGGFTNSTGSTGAAGGRGYVEVAYFENINP